MRTTLDLPEDFLKETMKVAHIRTKTQVIITALEQLIRKKKFQGLKNLKEKQIWTLTLMLLETADVSSC